MDHKVSKDMISSGMIPSGEKTQADLGKTQYGSAPSPSKLMDAYKSMYDKKEEVINEMAGKGMGMTPAPKPQGITPAKRVEKSNLPAKRVEKSNLPKPQDPAPSKPQKDFIKARMSDSPAPKTETKPETKSMGDTVKDRRKEVEDKRGITARREKVQDIMNKYGESVDLLAAYRAVYEHHKKDADGNTIPHEDEEVNEGKIPAGLQAYLDKKKGKKEDKKDMKEDVDKFDIVFNHFISEGYSEKEAYAEMANLTEEQLDEFLKALAQAGMRGAESVGKATRGVSTSLAKQGAMTDPKFRRLGKVQGPAPNTPSQTLTDLRQRRQQQSDNLRGRIDTAASQLKSGSLKFGSTSQPKPQQKEKPKPIVDKRPPVQGPVTSITAPPIKRNRSKEVMQDEYQYIDEYAQILAKGAALLSKAIKPVKKAAQAIKSSSTLKNLATQTAVSSVVGGMGGGGPQKQRADRLTAGSYQASSADLFDIVKGQLLDEGLSEEEIRDIMLTLTPDEILSEVTAEFVLDASKRASAKSTMLGSQGDKEGMMKKAAQAKRLYDASAKKRREGNVRQGASAQGPSRIPTGEA